MITKASREYAFALAVTAACVTRYDVKLVSVGMNSGSVKNRSVNEALPYISRGMRIYLATLLMLYHAGEKMRTLCCC